MSDNITKLISDEHYDTANEFLGDLLSNKVSDYIEIMKVEIASTMFAEATGTCPECMESNKECGCEEEEEDAEEIDEAAKNDEDPVDRPDVPFGGPYRDATKARKDKFGNVIKNRAKSLAKQGMAGVRKEEVTRKVMEESSNRNFKIGQQVHLGMGTKGGAGYKGTLQKIEGDTAHVQLSDEGKYGPRVVKGHVSKLSMTEAKQGMAEGNQENKAKKNDYVSSIIQKKLHQSVLPSLKYGRRELKKEEAEQMDERSDQAIANKAMSKQVRKERGASGANYTKNQYPGDILKHRVGSVGMAQNKPAAAKQHILTTRDQKHSGVYREQIDELSKKTLQSYSDKAKEDSRAETKAGHAFAWDPDERDFAPGAFKKAASRAAGAAKADRKIKNKEKAEQMDELSKQTLGSYIKKASHDVTTKGALVRHFATKSRDERSKDNYVQSRKDDETSNKIFSKSWKRRQGMAKAVDRLTKEEVEQMDELSKNTKDKYVAKRGAQLSSTMYGSDKNYNSLTGRKQANAVKGIKKAMGAKEEAEQMAEGFVIHKGKHEPGTKSSLEGVHHGVTVEPVYTDEEKAQSHADKINAGRGYKPGDEKSSLYGGVLYQVSPAKSMKEEVEQIDEAEITDMQKLTALGMKGSEKARTMQALSTYRRKGDINKLSPGHRTLVAGYIEKTGGLGSVNRSAAMLALKKDKMQKE